MTQINVSDYESIFYPKSIAVVGASNSGMGFGSGFLRTHLAYGYNGELYPVNPKGGEIMGLKAYTTVEEIPYPVDFATIAVPAKAVPDTIRKCIKKGIKGAQILASGFREAGPEGQDLEDEVVRIAKAGGLRLVGPNCFGVHSPAARLTLLPGMEFSPEPGHVGLISQSGGGACDLVHMSQGRGLSFSIVISCGNSCDIDATEMIRYFEADPKTRIVGAYIEGVRDGRSFFDALKSCAQKKPVVIMKGGLSDEGYRGTMGHTGSMAGTQQAWEAAIKSAGAVIAHDMRDLVECMMGFNCLDGFTGGGAGILAGGGSRAVESLDAATRNGIAVPILDEETATEIQSFLPPVGGKGGNPADLFGPGVNPVVMNPIMDTLAKKKDITHLVMYANLFGQLNMRRKMEPEQKAQADIFKIHQEIADKAIKIRSKTGKPLSVILLDCASNPKHLEIEGGRFAIRHFYTTKGIPCFDSAAQTFSILKRVGEYYGRREGKKA